MRRGLSSPSLRRLGRSALDPFLLDEIRRLAQTHRLGPKARADIEALVDKLLDDRLLATTAPGDDGGARPGEHEALGEDLGLIGRGGMGEVRRVRDPELERPVAVKIARPDAPVDLFVREARRTAALDHPNIPPVFRFGRLPDGRPFFTMREVHGRPLSDILADRGGWGHRRLLEGVRRAAETVGYAHSRRVVHRDLKPANLLFGEHGEVWVVDWGIAALVGEPSAAGVGTVGYIAPEMAAGGQLHPTADVYALGVILYELLSGRSGRARRRDLLPLPVPPPLARLVARALSPDPAVRPQDAAQLAAELTNWLDGESAREGALATLMQAEERFAAARAAKDEATRALDAVRSALDAIPSFAPAEEKGALWAEEEGLEEARGRAELDEGRAVELVRAAIEAAPEAAEPHAFLAARLHERIVKVENEGGDATRLEIELRAHDRGTFAHFLSGVGAVTLETDPPGVEVVARPLIPTKRRLVPGAPVPLGRTPLRAVPLARGSWLLELRHPDRAPVRYPVYLRRNEHWDASPPGGSEVLRLPRLGELDEDDVFVPGGPFMAGGDPVAANTLAASRPWLPSFVIRRYAVTNAEYTAWLNAMVDAGDAEQAMAHVPRDKDLADGSPGPAWYTFDGRFQPRDLPDWSPRHPVMLIPYASAVAYAAWRAERTGLGWHVPDSLEVEKAARGVDGRAWPWGNGYDASFASVAGAMVGRPQPTEVDAGVLDESVYGVRSLAGCVRMWCRDAAAEGRREARGSYWAAGGLTGRCAARFFYPEHIRTVGMGIRITRPW